MKKRMYKTVIKGYEVTIQDYGYTSRPPVAVRISGTTLGECTNLFGEPCYFYTCLDAYTLEDGLQAAHKIIDHEVTQ